MPLLTALNRTLDTIATAIILYDLTDKVVTLLEDPDVRMELAVLKSDVGKLLEVVSSKINASES